jgi:hypothetical protein
MTDTTESSLPVWRAFAREKFENEMYNSPHWRIQVGVFGRKNKMFYLPVFDEVAGVTWKGKDLVRIRKWEEDGAKMEIKVVQRVD